MLELPEAAVVAGQIDRHLAGKTVQSVSAAKTPHKLTWFAGDPADYPSLLRGRTIDSARPIGGMVEVTLGDARMTFSDGAGVRFYEDPREAPERHQLRLDMTDSTSLVVSVRMYGGVCCFLAGTYDNPYYLAAVSRPSPLTEGFTEAVFRELLSASDLGKLSAKAFLATEQRIPGLGNGVLQDILFGAKVHPRRKMHTLGQEDCSRLYRTIVETLRTMADRGGRDSEKDLFGRSGGYATLMGKRTVGKACPDCGGIIEKASYMGGSVYFCPGCQRA
jgi:formamidopyrimidine-DNA glycosylase